MIAAGQHLGDYLATTAIDAVFKYEGVGHFH